MLPAEDAALQELAAKLVDQKLLWDSRRKKFIQPVDGRIPAYSIAKYAILKLLESHGYDHNLTNPDSRLRTQLRQRRAL